MQFKNNSVDVLDVPLFNKSIDFAISNIIDNIKMNEKKNLCISATGAHGIVYAKKNENFKNILSKFYFNLPDGMPSVWIGKLKGEKEIQRCYGPDFFRELIVTSAKTNIKHFLCGGKDGVAEELKRVCENKFGNKNIVGVFYPPFREMTDEEVKNLASEINSKEADIVWIGLSTPKQEIFAYRLSQYTNVHFICTVGAAFDFHTGRVVQSPKLIQKIGMEWFFRLLIEPKRLWKRYFEIVPLFVWYNIVEIFTGKFLIKKIE